MPKAMPSRNPNPSREPRSGTAVTSLEPLKWGILATGTIARKFVRDLHASGAGLAVACGSRTIEGARAFAAAHGIPKAYGSYGELARDPEVEAVYVATPHTLHFEDTMACLRNGKAVLCEKPLAVNARQANQLFEAAEKHGVFLMEALWTFFLPALVQARRWWSDGSIGELRLVQADFGARTAFDPRSRLYNAALAGGALLDLGIYPLALAQLAAGNKTPRVKASATLASTGVDETTSILIDWHSGLRAHLSCSIGLNTPHAARIYGSEGIITLPDFWKAKVAILESAGGRTVFEDNRTTEGYDFEARAVTQAIRSGLKEDSTISKAFSLRLATTMDTIRKQIGVVYPGDEAGF